MWYIVDLLFAQKPEIGNINVQCESCNVLFQADSGIHACSKAQKWAKNHEKDNNYRFAGISNVWKLKETQPKDGDEIAGTFYEEANFWERLKEFIPNTNDIPAIKLEENPDKLIKELVSKDKINSLKKIFGDKDST
jgi:hypothetical protein